MKNDKLKQLKEKSPALFNALQLDIDTLEEIKERFKKYGFKINYFISCE